MGILDKFKKKDYEDFPDIDSLGSNKTPSLGPAAPEPASSLEIGSSSMGMQPSPQPSSLPNSQQNIQMIQNKIDILTSKVDSIKVELASLIQKIQRIEQLMSGQRSGQSSQQTQQYQQQTQHSSSLPGYAQPPSQQEEEKDSGSVWPF